MTAAVILVVLAALFLLTRSKKSKPAPAPSGWRILYSTGFPDAPTLQGDALVAGSDVSADDPFAAMGRLGLGFWRGD